MRYVLMFVCLSIVELLISQNSLNMELLGSFRPITYGYNDIWGYVDSEDNEYAIIGSRTSIYFVDVTECDNPQLVYQFNGSGNEWWRDFKVYDDYVYAVMDFGNEGMHIFDMSALPNGNIVKVATHRDDFRDAHNIFIDEENHKLFAIDLYHPSSGDTDIAIYDLQSNPTNPTLLYKGYLGGGGIHDANAKDDILYTSHYYGGKVEIYDVSHLSTGNSNSQNTPIQLESLSGLYGAHSTWNDTDEDYAYLAAEVANQPFKIIDLENLPSPNDITTVKLPGTNTDKTFWDPLQPGSGLIAHNPFALNDFLYVSHYEDGVKVYDISNRKDPQVAAYCDIYPSNDGSGYNGFFGTWGVYPYLPSGCVIASDDTFGLNTMQLSRTISDTCTPILDLPGTINSDTYSASNYIESNGFVSGSNVKYQAEDYIDLNAGFEVPLGKDFEATIEPCVPNN